MDFGDPSITVVMSAGNSIQRHRRKAVWETKRHRAAACGKWQASREGGGGVKNSERLHIVRG